ncbi:SpaH/EbpB family LPXTG-anchored major pilin [Lacticaseibacillus manihotivorans]|uniref:Gram-positive cocci surface proteins LPxTG domain-containing protein n=2 Tax=Lacticaseibacillus manihotivorans TaxID=88233 RepID=A0A0R1Q3L0_9LACO|nr:SpaH/EbpB family LPXTG-anchored major pilin [Lacticaseibacillus manihotivorans]KRL39193.1 hypothetical protein FD01_GL002663 [Lacticaseibacillus manihotivorans DSM 13343 = JCM 12514]QFQ91922.1 SpaH/EbpB family LPXTG-anchored major pilin [Lacticaseibacillus manihotivorans]
MKTTKLTRTLLTGMMTCTMALTAVSVGSFVAPGATQTVLATDTTPAPDTFTLNLHKLKVLDGREFENDGSTNIPGVNLPGLANVDFQIYNVTAQFYAAKALPANEGKTNAEIAKLLSDSWDYDSPAGTLVDTVKTNANGVATRQLDTRTDLNGNKVHSVYMFVEVAGTDNADYVTARPFILGMSDKLAKQPSVDLYAKNYGVQKDLLDDDGDALADGYYSYNVGDELHYVSSSPIPTKRAMDAEAYTGLRFYDEMTHAGTDLVAIDDIYYQTTAADGVVTKHSVATDFNQVFTLITSNDSGWANSTRKFAGFEYRVDWSDTSSWTAEKRQALTDLLDKIAGKQLYFSYTMTINKEATPYQSIGNKFYGYFTNKHGEDKTVDNAPEVETGGHKFVKRDADTKVGLNNAHFLISKVINGETKYAKLWVVSDDEDVDDVELTSTNGIYKPDKITWVDKADATTIISGKNGNQNGQLAIYGLETGAYQLVETKAPTGYTFKKANTDFTVEEAIATTQELESENVDNYGNDPILPITGGTGIVAFLAVGAMAMGGALYYKKKKA